MTVGCSDPGRKGNRYVRTDLAVPGPVLRVRHLGSLDVGRRPPLNPRERHLAQILTQLERNGPSSRAVIAESCGLGISTMSELIGELRGRRLVAESEPVRTRTVGRPLREVRLDAEDYLIVGAQIDARRMEARVDTLGGRELRRGRRPWCPASDDPLAVLSALLDDLLDDLPEPHVGGRPDELPGSDETAAPLSERLLALEIGVPGVVRRATGEVVHAREVGMHDRPLGDEVLELLGRRGLDRTGVGIENDCNFAALAASVRAGCPAEREISVYVGGEFAVGGTVLVGDRLLRGAGAAGELGHCVVEPQGQPCWCGRRGCLATVADLRLLVISTGLDPDAAAKLVDTERRRARALVLAAAEAGDPRVAAALQTVADGLTAALLGAQALLDPDLVLIGGFLGALGSQLEDRLSLDRNTASFTPETENGRGPRVQLLAEDEGAVVGGALLSARALCLQHPLHFGRRQPLPPV